MHTLRRTCWNQAILTISKQLGRRQSCERSGEVLTVGLPAETLPFVKICLKFDSIFSSTCQSCATALPNQTFFLLDPKYLMFENIRADFEAHGRKWGAQGFWVMVVYRFGRWRYTIRPAIVRKPFSLMYKVLYKAVQMATGVELPCEVPVGKNFVIEHFGGIVISGFSAFGDNCRIRTGVVVGLARVEDPCAPVFGNNVDIGAGAKILGRIQVGDNVLIGANSVVVRDVPSNSIAVGVPARIKSRQHRHTPTPPAKKSVAQAQADR
ncbi:serine O-acetyltransferase [Hydrogenophaga laconesensis]|uniref:Serine acetyltransferase n=1 Tax=Hydrogenophaga laconesensis TaxID=1805971 RepID=A0ABU1VAI6_9BURK|nr:serine acetyltransferase [Hydrogenophaga laconesensis]MDR7094474.1 serine acetyltransferase [Hydrogenophaga laconesensis]